MFFDVLFFILLILMLFSGTAYIYLISYHQNHSVIETDQQYLQLPHPSAALL